MSNTIRWSEVFADVDVSVRYIHDIMKVDVILKREFMRDLRAVVSDGSINPEAFLIDGTTISKRLEVELLEALPSRGITVATKSSLTTII